MTHKLSDYYSEDC